LPDLASSIPLQANGGAGVGVRAAAPTLEGAPRIFFRLPSTLTPSTTYQSRVPAPLVLAFRMGTLLRFWRVADLGGHIHYRLSYKAVPER
jgi:hypothetical protein